MYLSGRDFSYELEENTWHWVCAGTSLRDLPKPSLNNDNQVQNAAGVLMVLHELAESFPVKTEIIHSSLRNFHLAGRFQIIPAEVPLILDVAHNRQASTALAMNLGKLPATGKTHLVIGMLKDKNHEAVLQALSDLVDCWYFASLVSERGASAEELIKTLCASSSKEHSAAAYNDVSTAIEAARTAASPGDRIVITGSFITVGDATRHLQLQR